MSSELPKFYVVVNDKGEILRGSRRGTHSGLYTTKSGATQRLNSVKKYRRYYITASRAMMTASPIEVFSIKKVTISLSDLPVKVLVEVSAYRAAALVKKWDGKIIP